MVFNYTEVLIQWDAVCEQISAPQFVIGQAFYAYVYYVNEPKYADLECHSLIRSLPDDYPAFFCFIVDETTLGNEDYPVLVVAFAPASDEVADDQWTPKQTTIADIKTFRAIPSTLQSIENNLSIANIDFEAFVSSVDIAGIFRGFSPSTN